MKDLEFHVSREGETTTLKITEKFGEACKFAIAHSASTGYSVVIDVIAWSKKAARAWGGDSAVEVFEEDPEASVHERILIKAESQGRIA